MLAVCYIAIFFFFSGVLVLWVSADTFWYLVRNDLMLSLFVILNVMLNLSCAMILIFGKRISRRTAYILLSSGVSLILADVIEIYEADVFTLFIGIHFLCLVYAYKIVKSIFSVIHSN